MNEVGLRAGDRLSDRYVIKETIASGGTSFVFLGDDQVLDRPVAVKVIRAEVTSRLDRERFLGEAEVLARLAHPNLPAIYDAGDGAGTAPHLVMEYVDGVSLARLVSPDGVERLEQGVGWVAGVGRALGHMHRCEVLHRDIKLRNILVTARGHVKLVDLGIATPPDSVDGMRRGTAGYVAPEVARGTTSTVRSDLYSLGVVLYRVLTGRLPFDGEAGADRERAPSPAEIRADLPRELEALILRLLAPEPADRPADAFAVVDELERGAAVLRRSGSRT